MAKFQERDPRWIVEERSDGTNVKNWHWSEKDCMAWTKTRLAELLEKCSLVKNAFAKVETTTVTSVTGEVFINNRKNKLFVSFELNVKIGYRAEVVETGGKGEGVIEVPNLSDEQEMDDWEFRIMPSAESADNRRIKDAIQESGREELRRLLAKYVEELKNGVPVKEQHTSKDQSTPEKTQAPRETAQETEKESRAVELPQSAGFHELRLVEKYHANPQDIFDCLTLAGKLQAFTQSPAKVDARPDGEFSWFDGAISGRFIDITAPSKLTLDWRFNNWPENHFSQVTILLENPENGLTLLKLHQTRIPEEDDYGHTNVLAVTENGWKDQILTRIKAIFGYGI